MSGIWEVYLWRVTGKNIRNNSGNCHIYIKKKSKPSIKLNRTTHALQTKGKQNNQLSLPSDRNVAFASPVITMSACRYSADVIKVSGNVGLLSFEYNFYMKREFRLSRCNGTLKILWCFIIHQDEHYKLVRCFYIVFCSLFPKDEPFRLICKTSKEDAQKTLQVKLITQQ